MGKDVAGQAGARAGSAAQLIDEQTDALAELESRNVGKAKWQCAAEVKVPVATPQVFEGIAQHPYGRSRRETRRS